MEIPDFRLEHRLSDWPNCHLEARCSACWHISITPMALLLRHGDRTFRELPAKLTCQACGGRPAPVYLCSGPHRINWIGINPSWAAEIVPPPPAVKANRPSKGEPPCR